MSKLSDVTGVNFDTGMETGNPHISMGPGIITAPILPFLPKKEEQTPEDPAVGKYRQAQQVTLDSMLGQANKFRSDIPGYESQIQSQIEGQAKANIAAKQREIRSQMNRRGLLYSGMRAGSENKAQAEISSEAAGQKAKVAPELNKMADDLENQAMQMAQEKFANDLDAANRVYDLAIQRAKERAQNSDAFLRAGGTALGAYYGSKK